MENDVDVEKLMKSFPISNLKETSKDRTQDFYVSTLARPGMQLFITRLEYEHYTPDTPSNDVFHLHAVKWCDMQWFVVQIPTADRDKAMALAAECDIKLTDGLPLSISTPTDEWFPLDPDSNSFVMVNLSGSAAYTSNREERATLISNEMRACAGIINAHYRKFTGEDKDIA